MLTVGDENIKCPEASAGAGGRSTDGSVNEGFKCVETVCIDDSPIEETLSIAGVVSAEVHNYVC